MIQTRKGLSDIVTNVLIILLVLVAIGIIWAFVRPTIQEGAGQLQGTGDCLTVSVKAVKCVRNGAGDSFNLTYNRDTGQGELQEIKFLMTDGAGNRVTNSTTVAANLPQPLESRSVANVFFTGLSGNPTFDVAVVIKTNNPDGKLCSERNEAVTCA